MDLENEDYESFIDIEEGANIYRISISQERLRIYLNKFQDQYKPSHRTIDFPHPNTDVDFSLPGVYSQFNWEIFFHVPFIIAGHLCQNRCFEESQKWYRRYKIKAV